MLRLKRKENGNPMAHTTQTPSPKSKHEPSSEADFASLSTPPTPLTDPSPSIESLDAKTSALKKLNDASKEMEIATIRKRDVMLFVVEAQDRVQRAKEELSRAELDDGQATKRIADAEQAMRSGWKDMDTALGRKAV